MVKGIIDALLGGIIKDNSEIGGLTSDRSTGVRDVRSIRTDPRHEIAAHPVGLVGIAASSEP